MTTSPSLSLTTRNESFADGLTLRVDERGSGRPILVLHGARGPQSVADFSSALAQHAHVFSPTHPGFEGEPRPHWFTSVDDLALTYLELLERYDLRDVILIGLSFGGWVAAQTAVFNSSRLGGLILVDAAGIQIDNMPMIRPPGGPGGRPPAAGTPEQEAARAATTQTMATYAKDGFIDPKLRRRLASVTIPALAVWGANDPIIPPDYGRAYAQSLANARFELIPEAGHMPQLDQPERLLAVVDEFIKSVPVKVAQR